MHWIGDLIALTLPGNIEGELSQIQGALFRHYADPLLRALPPLIPLYWSALDRGSASDRESTSNEPPDYERKLPYRSHFRLKTSLSFGAITTAASQIWIAVSPTETLISLRQELEEYFPAAGLEPGAEAAKRPAAGPGAGSGAAEERPGTGVRPGAAARPAEAAGGGDAFRQTRTDPPPVPLGVLLGWRSRSDEPPTTAGSAPSAATDQESSEAGWEAPASGRESPAANREPASGAPDEAAFPVVTDYLSASKVKRVDGTILRIHAERVRLAESNRVAWEELATFPVRRPVTGGKAR